MKHILDTISEAEQAKTAHMFVLTGNVQDVIPLKGGNPTIYHSIEAALQKKYADHMFFSFDLARGLRVEGEMTEVVADIMNPPPPDVDPNDAVAQAQVELQDSGPVVITDPVDAFNLLNHIFEISGSPIILFLPRLELLVPSTMGGNTLQIRILTTALLDMAQSRSTREAGHKIVCTTSNITSVVEELRALGTQIKTTHMPKPNESERSGYLVANTLSKQTQRQLNGYGETINELRGKEKNFKEDKKAELDTSIKKVKRSITKIKGEQAAALDKLDKEMKRDLRSIKKAATDAEKAFSDCLARNNAELSETIVSLRARKAELEARISTLSITKKNWDSLQAGDRIYGKASGDGFMTIHTVVKKGKFHLTLDDGVDPIMYTDTDSPSVYIWKEGGIKAGKDANLSAWADHIIRKDDIDASQEIHTISQDLLVLEVNQETESFDEETTEAQKLKKEKDAALTDLEESQSKRREELNGDFENRIQEETTQIELYADQIVCLDNDESLPELAEIAESISKLGTQVAEIRSTRFEVPKMGVRELARISNGLGYRDLWEMLATARVRNQKVDHSFVGAWKMVILNEIYGHLLKIVEPGYGFEGIGGLDYIKDEFKFVVDAIKRGDHARVPMGTLLLGPPGTGKTAIAEALARECGFAFVEIQNTRNMYVGKSEERLQSVLDALTDLAPVVVLRDEVDEDDSGRDSYQGDSGVSGRMRSMWMRFLSNPKIRGKVLVVSCTNRPDRMDPALKRSGRTDVRIPVLMPDEATCERVFEVMFKERYGIKTDIRDFKGFAKQAHALGISGADIEHIVLESNQFAGRDKGNNTVKEEHLQRAMDEFIPSADQDQIERMTIGALQNASSRRFIPPGFEGFLSSKSPKDKN